MGCGQSKGDSEREAVSSKLNLLLRWRFEELKRRRNSHNGDSFGALSKKELLKHSNRKEDDLYLSNSNNVDDIEKKSESSQEESLQSSSSTTCYCKDDDCSKWEAHKKESKVGNGVVNNNNNNNSVVKQERLSENKEQGDENAEELNEVEGGIKMSNAGFSPLLCPGSPSFRVYCVEYNASSDDDDFKDDDEESDQKSHIASNSATAPSMMSHSEELVTPSMEKSKRRGRFRKVMMGKGTPVAVKNLLNVTSCYHPSRAHRPSNPQLLPQQAAS